MVVIALFKQKYKNITKPANVFKGSASTYLKTLSSFNTELRGFKFVTTLVLVFKKIESEDKTKEWHILFKLKSGNNY